VAEGIEPAFVVRKAQYRPGVPFAQVCFADEFDLLRGILQETEFVCNCRLAFPKLCGSFCLCKSICIDELLIAECSFKEEDPFSANFRSVQE